MALYQNLPQKVKCQILELLQQIKESFIVYSLFVSTLTNWSQNLASLQVRVHIADKIGQSDGIQSSNPDGFWQAHTELLVRAGKIRHTLMLCTYHAPKVESRATK